jgi:hypothetical protein
MLLYCLGCCGTLTSLCLARADVPAHDTEKNSRIIDLDVDIGADAVDYKYAHHRCSIACCLFQTFLLLPFSSAIANQESLSGLETEMRKLEGIVKEIVDEMDYLKRREEIFQNTNGIRFPPHVPTTTTTDVDLFSIDKRTRAKFRLVHNRGTVRARRVADNASARILQAQVLD